VEAAQPFEIEVTKAFEKWFRNLRDRKARAKINIRIRKASLGNLSDSKSVGGGVSEMRIDYGPGYRVYFTKKDKVIIILLYGGNKKTQSGDIRTAREILEDIRRGQYDN